MEDNDEMLRERHIKKGKNYCVAPEVLENRKITAAVDIFAIGCCVFYMFFGRFPYKKIDFHPD